MMIGHYRIMKHWTGKSIDKSGKIVSDHGDDAVLVVEDSGEPMCWGCGKPIISNIEKEMQTTELQEDDCKRLWSASKVLSKLNRCHITPSSLGGSDEADNLFLMCTSCHFTSPDTLNREAFFRWVYKQRKSKVSGVESFAELTRLINEELSDRNLPDYLTIVTQCPDMDFEKAEGYVKSMVTTHTTSLVTTSLIVGFADWLESQIGSITN